MMLGGWKPARYVLRDRNRKKIVRACGRECFPPKTTVDHQICIVLPLIFSLVLRIASTGLLYENLERAVGRQDLLHLLKKLKIYGIRNEFILYLVIALR